MKFFKLDKNSKKPSNIKWSDEKNYFTDTTTIDIEKK